MQATEFESLNYVGLNYAKRDNPNLQSLQLLQDGVDNGKMVYSAMIYSNCRSGVTDFISS